MKTYKKCKQHKHSTPKYKTNKQIESKQKYRLGTISNIKLLAGGGGGGGG